MRRKLRLFTWEAIQAEREREAKEDEAQQVFAAELLAGAVSQNFQTDPYYEGF